MKRGYGNVDDRIKDRYHGVNDPIANKILSKIKENMQKSSSFLLLRRSRELLLNLGV